MLSYRVVGADEVSLPGIIGYLGRGKGKKIKLDEMTHRLDCEALLYSMLNYF